MDQQEHNPFGRKHARATEETVGVIGKQFPATVQSDWYARCPTLVMVLSLVFPVVFMFVGIGSNVAVDVSLDGFTADPHESSSSAVVVNDAIDNWLDLLTGSSRLRSSVDTSRSKSSITFRQELRFDISLPEFSNWYYGTYLVGRSNPEDFAAVSNLLRHDNLQFVKSMEQYVIRQFYYDDMCFTNNLKFSETQASYPTCAPLTSVTGYFYPGLHGTLSNGRVDWPFSGQGNTYQVPYTSVVARLLSNPNYKWFTDKKMTNLYPYTRSVRTQITLATPFVTSRAGGPIATVRSMIRTLKKSFAAVQGTHPYIYFSYGGDQVQDALVDEELQSEYYKLGVMILIVGIVTWLHTRTFIMTVCIVIQLLLTYLASWGFYITVNNTAKTNSVASASENDSEQRALPLLSTISLFLIISFCLHGTLTFYDTFVHSAIMSTTGRRNNLSVSQRIAFTMRRASFGITIANVIAVIVFAINSSSAFQAVRDFSVMMIFALLFNIYFSWTTTPAYVLWHHYYFSRKRRVAQKQREVITERAEDVRRNPAMSEVLSQIQMHLRPSEEPYVSMATKEALLSHAEQERWKSFLSHGAGALVGDAKRELDEVIAALRNNREAVARRGAAGSFTPLADGAAGGTGVAGAAADGSPAEEFQFEMFIDVNTLQEATCDHFVSDRLVPANRMLHIPLPMTLRSADNASLVTTLAHDAQGPQTGELSQAPNEPPSATTEPQIIRRGVSDVSTIAAGASLRRDERHRGPRSQPIVQPMPHFLEQSAMEAFVAKWDDVATKLNLGTAPAPGSAVDAKRSVGGAASAYHHPMLPLVAYNWCTAHDPYWVVSESQEFQSPLVRYSQQHQTTVDDMPSLHQQKPNFQAARSSASHEGNMDDVEIPEIGSAEPQDQQPPRRNPLPPTEQRPNTPAGGGRNGRAPPTRRAPVQEYNNVFSKMRHRWKVRETEERMYCCGLLGKRVNESREERDARILARATKKEGYGRMERILTHFVAPWIDRWQLPLLGVFLVLFVVAIALSTRAKAAGVPKTLLTDVEEATLYEKMGNIYAQSGSCDFCSLYYRPYNTPKSASNADLTLCAVAGFSEQMNMLVDACGVCNGNDACVSCDGVPNGNKAITTCGTCDVDDSACSKCWSTASCSWCHLRGAGGNTSGGQGCANTCACAAGRGTCNAFTAGCDCKGNRSFGYGGADCSGCSDGWQGPGCAQQCSPTVTTPQCDCNFGNGQCTECPIGKRGYDCLTDVMTCDHGVQDGTGTSCICDPGWADGGSCQYHESCTYRGVLYAATEAPFSGCGCIGNWVGQNCTACACRNGGVCAANGTCTCTGPYYGAQCQFCAATCSRNGACPAQPLSPALMNLRSCLATCTFSELDNGVACSPCNITAWAPTATCTAAGTSPLACNQEVDCLWYGGQCVGIANPNATGALASTRCACKGAWGGDFCSVCGGPAGSTCLYTGNVKACDGFTYTAGVGAPAVDACGVCGGSGNCVGCDGIPNSGKVFDDCGVCGGDNGCLGATSASPIAVNFLFSISSTPVSTVLLDRLSAACVALQQASAGGIFIPPVSCVVTDYIAWQTSAIGIAASNTSAYSAARLYTYALSAGRLGDVGFNVNDASNANLQLLFMKVGVNVPVLTVASNDAIYDVYTAMLSLANNLQLQFSGVPVAVRQSSASWANAVAAHVSLVTLRFTSGVGMAVLFCLMGSVFCNLRLSLFATLGVVFVLCGTLAAASTQGWDIDAVTQICVAGVIAIAVEHLVHIIDGYQDYLQSTQSHMFAITTTKMHAFRGSLTRTGVSIITSTVAVIAVAAMFIPSGIQPFRRAAQVMITVHILTLFTAVFFGAALCAAGPVILIRHWAASTVLCCTCAVCAGIAILIIFLAGGVEGPSGNSVP